MHVLRFWNVSVGLNAAQTRLFRCTLCTPTAVFGALDTHLESAIFKRHAQACNGNISLHQEAHATYLQMPRIAATIRDTIADGYRRPHHAITWSLTAVMQVLYVPSFIEVAKFSWIQFLATFVFLFLFARRLVSFVIENQIVYTVVRDDVPKHKLL